MVERSPIRFKDKLVRSDTSRILADSGLLGSSFLAGYSVHEITQDYRLGLLATGLWIIIIKGILGIEKEAGKIKK